MKKIYVSFIFTIIFIVNKAHSQSPQYKSFRDYPLVQNIDSLEKVVQATRNNPEQYLHGLITIELNMMSYAGFFGQNLKIIKSLAYKLNLPLAIAMYQQLEGFHSREHHFGMAAHNTLQAIQYFESTKDTSGMIESYYSMLFSNALGNKYKINESKNSTIYYNRIMILGQQSSALRDKVIRVKAMANLEDMVTGKQYETKRVLEIIEEASLLLNTNPNIAPLDGHLYAAMSRLYTILSLSDSANYNFKSLEYDLKSTTAEKKLTSKINITSCLNTAIGYSNLGLIQEAEKYLLKGIKTMEQFNEEERDLNILAYLYEFLTEIQFSQKRYAAAKISWEKHEALISLSYSKLKNSFFEELNTQYILNEKEIENVQLKQENQLTELRNQQFITIGIIGIISLSIVLILLVFLFKSNKKLKSLIVFRDQLFSIIAHDLRSPMNTYQRYSDIIAYLVKTKQFSRLETTTQQMDQIGKNLSLLLNNLLNWSLNQQGLIKTSTNSINAKSFIEELLPIYNNMANLSSLTLINDIEEAEIIIDPDKFALIIRNMLDNAIKYSEENSQIQIFAKRRLNNYVFSITNKSKSSNLFKKDILSEFFKSDKDYLVGENKSLGVGIILVKQYSKIMGAKASFEFNVDNFAIFTFSIPFTT